MSEDNLEGNVETGLDSEKGWFGRVKDWLIDNWQTVIIILIVLIIGVGLYNYQQQKGAGTGEEGALSTAVEEREEETTESSDKEIAFEDDWSKDKSEDSSVIVIEEDEREDKSEIADLVAVSDEYDADKEDASESKETATEPVTIASENGKAYTASAESGDGITHLARKVVKKYLEENSVSDISDEQKIYIEDYLQNKTGQEFLALGETREFSENLIEEAVDMSRGLDGSDIDNLSKYKSRIANL